MNFDTVMTDIVRDIKGGRKIAAIKGFRMATHVGLKEGKDAVEALARAFKAEQPKVDPMAGRVEVRDSKNTDRVLGSVPRPTGNTPSLNGGDRYSMVVMGRMNLACELDPMLNPAMETAISRVDFGFRCVNWNVVLITDARLDTLMLIRGFRLPGETEEQAHVRLMYS